MTFLANLNWLPTQALMRRTGGGVKALFDTSFGSGSVAGYSLRRLSGSASSAVRVRRSIDDAEQDVGFTGSGLDEDALLSFVKPSVLAGSVLPGSLTGLKAGYSLRQVVPNYSGAVVKVRRDSDNVEQDFTATEVSDGTLTSWVGASNGLVTIWYNQGSGGSLYDVKQTNASRQPQIVNNGSLNVLNGLPVVRAVPNCVLRGENVLALTNKSVSAVFEADFVGAGGSSGGTGRILSSYEGGSSTADTFILDYSSSNPESLRVIDDGSVFTTDFVSGPNNQTSVFYTNNGSDLKLFNNTVLKEEINNISTNPNDLPFCLFEDAGDGIGGANAEENISAIQEVLIYNVAKSSERLAIENNINKYYDIYSPSEDGFVTTWYDQSGNGNDAVQASAGSQPKIVDNGVVVTDNGKPSLRFNQSWFKIGSTLGTTQLFADASEEFGVINVFRTNTGNQGALLAKARSATQNNFYTFILNDNLGIRVRGTNVVDTISNVTDKTNILFNDWDGLTFNSRLNDGGVINPDVGSDINDTSDINIGSRSNGEFLLTGWQSEVIIFDQSKFTDWNALFNNLLSYYFEGVYSTPYTLSETLTTAIDNIFGVAFNNDSSLLAAGSYDNNVYVYNTSDYSLVQTLTDAPSDVFSVAFNNDDTLLATGSRDNNVYVYNTSDWSLVQTLTDFNDINVSVVFNNDGSLLAAGSFDNNVYVYDTSDWSLVQTLTDATDNIFGVAFNNDGSLLATASFDNNVYVYNTLDWSLVQTLMDATDDVFNVAFNNDGSLLSVGSRDSNVYVYDTSDWSLVQTLMDSTDAIRSVSFIGGGSNYIAVGSNDTNVYVYNTLDWSLVQTLTDAANGVFSVAFNNDGSLLATGSFDNNVYVYKGVLK